MAWDDSCELKLNLSMQFGKLMKIYHIFILTPHPPLYDLH